MSTSSCNTHRAAAVIAAVAAALSFSAAANELPPGTALAAPQGDGGKLFTRLDPTATGLDFRIDIDVENPRRRLYEIAFAGAGIAVGDYDGDGRPDLYFSHHTEGNRLFRQTADFEFTDVTEAAGLADRVEWSAGATFVDINNDGLPDLYVCHYDAPNSLYINQGDGTFVDRAADYGLDFSGASVMAAFADYDRDGDLDVYLLTSRLAANTAEESRLQTVRDSGPGARQRPFVPGGFREYSTFIAKPNGQFLQVAAGQRDHLLVNDDGQFREAPLPASTDGVGSRDTDNHMGMAAVWWDYDDDGWPDLYVANDLFGPDRLYRNKGDGSFENVVSDALPHTPWYSMGADFADINNDGLFDFMASDMAATTHYEAKVGMGDMDQQNWFLTASEPQQYMRNALYLNSGTGRFLEAAFLAGVASTDWTWSVKFGDYDNDGFSDLYVTNGMVRNFMDGDVLREIAAAGPQLEDYWEVLKHEPAKRDTNLAFRNRGGLGFDKTAEAWGLAHTGLSFAAAAADLDRDGDLDLVVNNLDEPVSVYRNNSADGGRVLVQLAGSDSNSQGLGATVRVTAGGQTQVRQLSASRGFMTSDEAVLHFGTGDAAVLDSLTIDWPSGRRQVFSDLPVGRFYAIAEGGDVPGDMGAHDLFTLYERNAGSGLDHRHREIGYDDYRVQPLLPAKLSQLGPGAAWGDADGDGDDDLYVGGAAGQPGVLYVNDGGSFRPRAGDPWEDDEHSEDMGALWLDADSDGDLDLLVTSGSSEFERDDPDLADRLYLNVGDGEFTHAPHDSLPSATEASSVIAASDFDRDGDLDLFIGGRTLPGAYPETPASRLLRNDGGNFTDVTDSLAPGLRRAGMVTGALWSDADGDADPDLLLTVEWGPVRYFRNDGTHLLEYTDSAGLGDLTGWWNGIAGLDIDNDGDTDYVVTNTGLNTKYHASQDEPAVLYYGDFGNSGKRNLVEVKLSEETELPVRGLSCSTDAMPFLADEFHTFDQFARADIEDLYSPTRLQEADRYAATELRSGILVNDGRGEFEFKPLPTLAQISPAFGVVSGDFDHDGNADIYLVQNSHSPQVETGRMDGGLSVLLLGDGNGGFEPVWPHRSGLVVQGDAKALAMADIDDDGRADFVVTRNDDSLLAFTTRKDTVADDDKRPLAVRLHGASGNPSAIGSRILAIRADGSQQAVEIHAGSGYLSQSAPLAFLGNTAQNPVTEIRVRWPDGRESLHRPGIEPVKHLHLD